MRRAIVACEAAMGEMEAALKPGISENELWAELHRGNIAPGKCCIEILIRCFHRIYFRLLLGGCASTEKKRAKEQPR